MSFYLNKNMGQNVLMYIHFMIIRHGHRSTVSVNWVCGKIMTQKQFDAVLLTLLNEMTGAFQKHRIFIGLHPGNGMTLIHRSAHYKLGQPVL